MMGGADGVRKAISSVKSGQQQSMESALRSQGNQIQAGGQQAGGDNELSSLSDGQIQFAVTRAMRTKDPMLPELRRELVRRHRGN
jgi:hypothetical protein